MVSSLAIAAGKWGLPEQEPAALVYFCPPQGEGSVHTLRLGSRERKQWASNLARAVNYFLHSMVPVLVKGLEIAGIASPQRILSPVRPPPPPLIDHPLAQTPTIAIGKWVVDPKYCDRPRVVRELDMEKGIVKLSHGEENGQRSRKYDISKIVAAPYVPGATWELPTRIGENVRVVGGRNKELYGQNGVVQIYGPDVCRVHVNGSVHTISRKYLECLNTGRQVTVPASQECLKIPLDNFGEVMRASLQERKIQLTGAISFAKLLKKQRKRGVKTKKQKGKKFCSGQNVNGLKLIRNNCKLVNRSCI